MGLRGWVEAHPPGIPDGGAVCLIPARGGTSEFEEGGAGGTFRRGTLARSGGRRDGHEHRKAVPRPSRASGEEEEAAGIVQSQATDQPGFGG